MQYFYVNNSHNFNKLFRSSLYSFALLSFPIRQHNIYVYTMANPHHRGTENLRYATYLLMEVSPS
jgi:hypothetical protein